MPRFSMMLARKVAITLSVSGAAVASWLLLMTVAPQYKAYADPAGGTVGTGTPASCTEAALGTALSGGGTVTFNCGANPYTITLTFDKVILADTTINGGGKITLSGSGTTYLFQVFANRLLTLQNIVLSDGNFTVGGCIYVAGSLTAIGTTFQNCHSPFNISQQNGRGGAIYGLNAHIILSQTRLLNNRADNQGGAIYLSGGTAQLDNVNIIGNRANFTYTSSGGGIFVTNGTWLTLTHSSVNGNNLGYLGAGGGLAAYTSTLQLSDVLVNNNVGQNAGSGGGLYLQNVTATLTALTVSGNTNNFAGGGITSRQSRVTLNNSQISGNSASANGGGLYTFQGTLTINDSQISGNTVGNDGGGLDLYNTLTTLTDVTISSNQGGRDGGGINHYQNTLTLNNVTLSGNINTGAAVAGNQGSGGAIYNNSGLLLVNNSTLNNNSSSGQGGGLYNASSGTGNLTNATLSANTAITGGGIYNEAGFINNSIITLTNVTLKDNSATDGGGLFNANDSHNYFFLKNTILTDSPSGGNCKGKAMTSSKYSLSSDGTCALAGLGNQNSTAPLLMYLTLNGGSTKTHLPKINSPAIDGVSGSDCPSTDQRGLVRPQGLSCDIGAVERQPNDPLYSVGVYLPLVLR